MKVLVVDASDRGGIARYTDHLVAGLADAGAEVSLAAPAPRVYGALRLRGLRWRIRPRGPAGRLLFYLRRILDIPVSAACVLAVAARSGADVVNLHTAVTRRFDDLLVRTMRRRAPVVLTVHNAVPHESPAKELRLERRRWEAADMLVVHGAESLARVGEAAPGVPARSVHVDLIQGVTGVDKAAAREEVDDTCRYVCLMLGLARPYKGFDLMERAWPVVRAALPEACLVVAGQVPEPFDALTRLLAQPGVTGHLRWLTDRETEVWAAAADLVLLPYSHGTHSGVLHRAVANGTPCMVSPSLEDEARRFSTGPALPLDPQRWAEAIVEALTDPPAPPRLPQGPSLAEQMLPLFEEARAGWERSRR